MSIPPTRAKSHEARVGPFSGHRITGAWLRVDMSEALRPSASCCVNDNPAVSSSQCPWPLPLYCKASQGLCFVPSCIPVPRIMFIKFTVEYYVSFLVSDFFEGRFLVPSLLHRSTMSVLRRRRAGLGDVGESFQLPSLAGARSGRDLTFLTSPQVLVQSLETQLG